MASRDPEQRIRVPMVVQDWLTVTFVHWSYPPAVVQALLPADLTVHTIEGRAWVSLTPFRVERMRIPRGPRLPGVSSFAETNLRTYVLAADGTDGLHFFDIEASNAVASRMIRSVFGLPYHLATMGVAEECHPHYISTRSAPSGDVGHDVRIEIGDSVGVGDELDQWLVGRWRAYGRTVGRRISIPVEHAPWELREATLLRAEQDLLAAVGLPSPPEEPRVRYSPGVSVRFGFPRLVRAR